MLCGAVGLAIVILLAVVYPLVFPSHDPALESYINPDRAWFEQRSTVHMWDTSWDGSTTLGITSQQTWVSNNTLRDYVYTEVVQKFSTTSDATAALSSKTAGLTLDQNATPRAIAPIAVATGDIHPSVFNQYYLPNSGGYRHFVDQWDNFIIEARYAQEASS